MTKSEALERAAQAWCQPTTSNRPMDPGLAEAFADILVAETATPGYDLSIHHNPDARAWAKLFASMYPEGSSTPGEDTMIGWFANAMMAMHDFIEGQRRRASASEPSK